MVSKRVRSDRKTKSKSTSVITPPTRRFSLFGDPLVLAGEDAAAYHELLARICAAVKPVDIIEEIFIIDLASLEWEVLRWRRLKFSLIQACVLPKLESFLRENLEDEQYAELFADDLTEILQENLLQDQADDFAQTLAHKCARNEPDAVAKVSEILAGIKLDIDDLLNGALANRAKELALEFIRREPDAVALVHELLTGAGVTMDALITDALVAKFGASKLDDIERIDRLTTIAESRRNASLREIDRHRAVLGETLRRSVQEIEDGEFEVIETTPAKGKKAA
jgi:hypothetical protein